MGEFAFSSLNEGDFFFLLPSRGRIFFLKISKKKSAADKGDFFSPPNGVIFFHPHREVNFFFTKLPTPLEI